MIMELIIMMMIWMHLETMETNKLFCQVLMITPFILNQFSLQPFILAFDIPYKWILNTSEDFI